MTIAMLHHCHKGSNLLSHCNGFGVLICINAPLCLCRTYSHTFCNTFVDIHYSLQLNYAKKIWKSLKICNFATRFVISQDNVNDAIQTLQTKRQLCVRQYAQDNMHKTLRTSKQHYIK